MKKLSFARSIGKAFLGLFFTLGIVTTIFISSMINFTSFDSFKSIVDEIFTSQQGAEIPSEEEFGQFLGTIKTSCRETGQGEFSLGLEGDIADVKIRCEDVEVMESGGDAIDFISSTIANNLYFKEYDCDFLSCLQRGESTFPLLFTKVANDFYKGILMYSIIVTVILGAILIVVAEGLADKLKSPGMSMLWASVPFIVLSFLVGNIVALFVSPEVVDLAQPIIESLLAPDFMIYVYILVAGAALVASGYYVAHRSSQPENVD